MKFQADVLGVPVVVPEVSETTALGAAYLAGVATGTWSEADVRAMWREAARYEPSMSDDQRESLLAGWARALAVAPLVRVAHRFLLKTSTALLSNEVE